MSSIAVSYSKSVEVFSCVSIIAQSCAIDKFYLISRLHNALWNCYFLSKLLLSIYLKFIYSWLLTEKKEKKYLAYLKTMLKYVNFHKKNIYKRTIKLIYIYNLYIYIYIYIYKRTIKNISISALKGHLQVIKIMKIVFAKFTWAAFRSPAFYLTFKNLKWCEFLYFQRNTVPNPWSDKKGCFYPVSNSSNVSRFELCRVLSQRVRIFIEFKNIVHNCLNIRFSTVEHPDNKRIRKMRCNKRI